MLKRLLLVADFPARDLMVITGPTGWMPDAVASLGIACIRTKFPSSRSIISRLGGFDRWIKQIAREMDRREFSPEVIQANNHIESLAVMGLAKHFPDALTANYFRDPALRRRGYDKYKCGEPVLRFAVSRQMRETIFWDHDIHVLGNSLDDSEISQFPIVPKNFPEKWLVIGDPSHRKGWDLVMAALEKINAANGRYPVKELVFTGIPTEEQRHHIGISEHLSRSVILKFREPFDNLAKAALDFGFVVSPSRDESFGMAVLEVAAAGVPVLSSITGVLDEDLLGPLMTFEADDSDDLTRALIGIGDNWRKVAFEQELILGRIRKNFRLGENISRLISAYNSAASPRYF